MSDFEIQQHITTKEQLLRAYIPFVKNGGFLIANTNNSAMGDTLKIAINFMDETETHTFVGKVILLNPNDISDSPFGVAGIQMTGETALKIHKKVETYLAGSLPTKNV